MRNLARNALKVLHDAGEPGRVDTIFFDVHFVSLSQQ
jgi:hypothetical protein